jgi:hypothetical protein
VTSALGVTCLLLSLLALPSVAETQPSPKIFRIGVLTAGSPEPLRESLRDLGYIEGRNIGLEIRLTEGSPRQVNDLALELARSKVDVIVTTYPAAVFSARPATATIPIVMVHMPDPVQLGLVASLAHPDGNITGTTTLSVDLSLKQLELLKGAAPRASRIAVLWNLDNPWHPLVVKGLREKTRSPGTRQFRPHPRVRPMSASGAAGGLATSAFRERVVLDTPDPSPLSSARLLRPGANTLHRAVAVVVPCRGCRAALAATRDGTRPSCGPTNLATCSTHRRRTARLY